MARYVIHAAGMEFCSEEERDVYEVWTIEVCDPNLPNGCNVVKSICFTDKEERDNEERGGFEHCNRERETVPGLRVNVDVGLSSEAECSVIVHADYCTEL